ncbi:MAG: hypothetical protein NE330_23345 [Lentisphaeraceae bacterium]|nr:hypothetical protein [Lentisphaeraceae bacterium]
MSKTEKILNSVRQDFFSNYSEVKAEDLLDQIHDDEGMWLAAPKVSRLSNNETIPVLLLAKYNALRLWEVDFPSNITALVSNLRTGQVYYGKVFPISKKYTPGTIGSRVGLRPEGLELQSGAEKIHLVDLRGINNFEFESDKYSVTFICFDRVTNTKRLSVKGPNEKLPLENENVPPIDHSLDDLSSSINDFKIVQVKKNNKILIKASFKFTNQVNYKPEKLVGTLLLVELDKGITVDKEFIIPVSDQSDTNHGDFEVELGDDFKREGLLYLLINGVLSEPLQVPSN